MVPRLGEVLDVLHEAAAALEVDLARPEADHAGDDTAGDRSLEAVVVDVTPCPGEHLQAARPPVLPSPAGLRAGVHRSSLGVSGVGASDPVGGPTVESATRRGC